MNKCNPCDWYRPKTSFCEYYLKGAETAVNFCPHCRSENEEQPTIDAETVRQGNWIKADSQQYFRKHYPCFTCSECGYRKDSQKKWNYCPNCGARMTKDV